MSVYLDTSVVIALFTTDQHSEQAEAWIMQGHELVVSHWVAAEFSSALSVQARQGRIARADVAVAERNFDTLVQDEFRLEVVASSDFIRARRLLVRDGVLKAPDALHLAVVERLGCVLATFDDALARGARNLGIETLSI